VIKVVIGKEGRFPRGKGKEGEICNSHEARVVAERRRKPADTSSSVRDKRGKKGRKTFTAVKITVIVDVCEGKDK